MRRPFPLFLALLGALLLPGCVDRAAQRSAMLAGLVGHPEADAVRLLGVPDRVIEANGHRFLAYSERRVDVLPGVYAGYGWWGPGGYGFGGFPPTVVERGCETTLEVAQGQVVGWRLGGGGCG